jgi:hypothetical protein
MIIYGRDSVSSKISTVAFTPTFSKSSDAVGRGVLHTMFSKLSMSAHTVSIRYIVGFLLFLKSDDRSHRGGFGRCRSDANDVSKDFIFDGGTFPSTTLMICILLYSLIVMNDSCEA